MAKKAMFAYWKFTGRPAQTQTPNITPEPNPKALNPCTPRLLPPLYQGMKTRTLKVVPLKVPLNMLLPIRPHYPKRVHKTQGYNLKGPRLNTLDYSQEKEANKVYLEVQFMGTYNPSYKSTCNLLRGLRGLRGL